MKELIQIQKDLKAPKGQRNTFGKYNYRSCEDILEAVKPLVHRAGCILTVSDEIIAVLDRVYVKATARLINGGEMVEVSAFAREPLEQKGMNSAQITGSASSYARKYALNGLFCIDDTKDADTDQHATQASSAPQQEEKQATSEQVRELKTKAVELEAAEDSRADWLNKQISAGMTFKRATEILEKLK